MTIGLREHAERRGDEWSVDDGNGRITWAEENERTNRLVHGLRGLGLGPRSCLAILGGNSREWIEAVNAASRTSLVFVPINWHFSAGEVAYVLENSGADALLADAEYGVTALTALTAAERAGTRIRIAYGGAIDGFADYDELLAASSPAEPADQGAGRPMFYTSGTTGRPKGVVPSVDLVGADPSVLVERRRAFVDGLGIPADGVAYTGAPLYHAGPLGFGYQPHDAGSRLIVRRSWDAEELLGLIDRDRITTVYAVPTHFTRLLKLPDDTRSAYDLTSLRAVWHTAAPCPPEVKRRMIEWWGPVINELYGASEGAAGGGTSFTCSSQEWLDHPGTVGRPNANTEVHILDDEDNDLGPNEVGRIFVRSRTGGDFSYLGDEEKTESVHLAPGLFSFGDIGYVDDDGYLYLSDREIDMIISGGVNIYPAEIEAALAEHELVADVSVFGVPNEEFGEEVKAAVELVGDADPDVARVALTNHCRERLAGYMVPRSFDFGPLPRTPTGKLPKRLLRAPYWEGTGRTI